MKIRNINPAGAVHVAALDMRPVGTGEVVDVTEEVAALLLIQTANWELVSRAEAAREFAEKAIADHLAELAEISATSSLVDIPGIEPVETVTVVTTGEGEVQ